MKEKNILFRLGIAIYIIMTTLDRFVYHITNFIYIPVAIIGIILILISFLNSKYK